MSPLDKVLQEAIEDFELHGYDDEERLRFWEERIKSVSSQLADQLMMSDRQFRDQMKVLFDRVVKRVPATHAFAQRFTIAQIHPRLHAELDRRILASANLIKLNREQMIGKTLQRFSGWATSVPRGGSDHVDRRELKSNISEPLRKLPFEQRRVLIDQGHKLAASVNATIASDGGAIAAEWRSNYRQANYDYRPEHRERDGRVYLIRGSWAHAAGLVKPGEAGYTDDVDQPAEKPFCRCTWTYLYALRKLPEGMLTRKGRQELDKVRAAA